MLIDVRAPRREAALFLPRIDDIVRAVFASAGFSFPDATPPRYSTTLDDHDARDGLEIKIHIREPVTAEIEGKWVSCETGDCTMQFSLVSLSYALGALAINLAALAIGPQTPLVVSELPPPEDRPVSVITHEREHRAIQL